MSDLTTEDYLAAKLREQLHVYVKNASNGLENKADGIYTLATAKALANQRGHSENFSFREETFEEWKVRLSNARSEGDL